MSPAVRSFIRLQPLQYKREPNMALIRLDEPTTKRIPPDTFSLWALAFRPFYLLAADRKSVV